MNTIEEKVQIIKWYCAGKSNSEISELFSAAFENQPVPAKSTISQIITTFEGKGCVSSDCKKCSNIDSSSAQPQDDGEIYKKKNWGGKPGRPMGRKTAADKRIGIIHQQKRETMAIHNEIGYNITGKPETNYDIETVKSEESSASSVFQSDISDFMTEEIKIENTEIDYHSDNEKKQILEHGTYRVKSETDDFSDVFIQNSECKMEEACAAGISNFSCVDNPDTGYNVQNIESIKTEENNETQKIKIEDIKIDYQISDEQPPIHEQGTHGVKIERQDFNDMSVQNGEYKMEEASTEDISKFSAFQAGNVGDEGPNY